MITRCFFIPYSLAADSANHLPQLVEKNTPQLADFLEEHWLYHLLATSRGGLLIPEGKLR
jgi:hypothetical protein